MIESRTGKPLFFENYLESARREGECLIYMDGMTTDSGHARVRLGKGRGFPLLAVHRIVWSIHNGPIPEGLVVRHSCDVPRCIEPAHLLIGTQLDNMRDKRERGRIGGPPAVNKAKTHCKRGHEFTAENTLHLPANRRGCKTCTPNRLTGTPRVHRDYITPKDAA